MDLCEQIDKFAGPLQKNESTYSRVFCFPDFFPGFDGHFPGNPILPGVVQTLLGELSSSIAIKKEFPDKKMVMSSISRCKFLRPVKPSEELKLEFSLRTKGVNHITNCTLTVEDEISATFQLIFSPKAG